MENPQDIPARLDRLEEALLFAERSAEDAAALAAEAIARAESLAKRIGALEAAARASAQDAPVAGPEIDPDPAAD